MRRQRLGSKANCSGRRRPSAGSAIYRNPFTGRCPRSAEKRKYCDSEFKSHFDPERTPGVVLASLFVLAENDRTLAFGTSADRVSL
jgi:hypothetical protein